MVVLTDAFLTKCATKLTILADITKHPATSMPETLSKNMDFPDIITR